MLRRVCSLPPQLKSLCETGCIYRSVALRHLACPQTTNKDFCVAPCEPQPCPCAKTDLVISKPGKKDKNEVFLL